MLLTGDRSSNELEIISTKPSPESVMNLGLFEDKKKKSGQRWPKPL